jgi:2-polyprenyl-6-methoxyphenol hydroxylase-like FAD-dependent oxidoreductase
VGDQAEVVGAGIAGLTVASLLARDGWKVRIHERAQPIQRVGSAIFLKENGLRVLDTIGVSQPVSRAGQRLAGIEMHGDGGRLLVRRELPPGYRTVCGSRAVLQQALLESALDSGAELVEGSEVEGVQPDGSVLLAGGTTLPRADLVVAADGVRSRVRQQGDFTARVRGLGEASYRFVITRDGEQPWTSEHWSGAMRVGIAPCARDQTYVFLCAPTATHGALRLPLPVARWSKAFPHLTGLMQRLAAATPVHATHSMVSCGHWVSGRVALLGDAASGQAPNLGQGAGLAVGNAAALVRTLRRIPDVPTALVAWEQSRRQVTRRTQLWSAAYTLLACRWPASRLDLRAEFLRGLASWGPSSRYWAMLSRAETDDELALAGGRAPSDPANRAQAVGGGR